MNTSLTYDDEIPKESSLVDISIVNCTSESDINKANNILLDDTYRVWQTKEKTKEAIVDIQFPQRTKIKAIDVANAGSPFIEILVGHVDWDETEYQIMVPMTSFMTATESKENINRNRIKRFQGSKLSSQTSKREWERVRVICRNPFFAETIGLSFIKIYAPEKKSSHQQLPQPHTQQMLLRFPSTDGDDGGDTSMSDLNKTEEDITVPTDLTSQTTELDNLNNSVTSAGGNLSKSQSLLSNIVPGKSITIKRESTFSIKNVGDNDDVKVEVKENKPEAVNNNNNNNSNNNQEEIKTDSEDETIQTLPKMTPSGKAYQNQFKHLLKGVVLVIGGLVDPRKSEIRRKAIEMGADYKSDWCREATHLVTPFIGTPKFNKAKGSGGSIALPEWIDECYKAKDRLPIKSFRVTREFSRDGGDDDDNKKKAAKVGKSISTTSKKKKGGKRKKSKSSDPLDPSDTEDEDDGLPNAYDLNDDFIDTGDVVESGDDNSSSSEDENGQPKFVPEDTDDLFADGMDYLKRTYGSSDPLVRDMMRGSKRHSTSNKPRASHKSWDDKQNEKYLGKQKEETEQQDSEQNTPPASPRGRRIEKGMFDDDVLFRDTTGELSALQIKTELTRMVTSNQLKVNDDILNNKDSMDQGDDTDEDNDIIPEHFKRTPTKIKFEPPTKGKEYILDPLPSFFEGLEFYLSFKDQSLRTIMTRYIVAYKGKIVSVPTQYIITDRSWEKSFNIALKQNPNIQFLKPSFIVESHNHSQRVAPLDHLIVPPNEL